MKRFNRRTAIKFRLAGPCSAAATIAAPSGPPRDSGARPGIRSREGLI